MKKTLKLLGIALVLLMLIYPVRLPLRKQLPQRTVTAMRSKSSQPFSSVAAMSRLLAILKATLNHGQRDMEWRGSCYCYRA